MPLNRCNSSTVRQSSSLMACLRMSLASFSIDARLMGVFLSVCSDRNSCHSCASFAFFSVILVIRFFLVFVFFIVGWGVFLVLVLFVGLYRIFL